MSVNHITRLVYTAVIGDYESFSSFKYEVSPNTKLVVFTDSDNLKSDTWEVIKINPRFPHDNIRSARYIKIMGPTIFADIQQSLWIDNTVLLKVSPDIVLDNFLKDTDFALPFYSDRDSVAAEFSAVQNAGYDDFTRVYEQLFHYQTSFPEVLTEKPLWTGILARNHTTQVKDLMLIWWEQVLRYSRRDQLSINYALSCVNINATGIPLNNMNSDIHEWPVYTARKSKMTQNNTILEAIQNAPISKLSALEFENEQLKRAAQQKTTLPYDLFQQLLKKLYADKPASIVQIGVCDGVINDPIYEVIKNDILTKKIVLIEPQESLAKIISENYSFHKNKEIVCCAVGQPGKLRLFQLKEKYHDVFTRAYLQEAPSYRVPAGFVSSDYKHVIKHVEGKLPQGLSYEDAIEAVSVESKNLKSILDGFNQTSFDVLQVDVEGMDDEVIYNCDLGHFYPTVLNFEHMHLSTERKRRLFNYLMSLGYNIYEYSASDTLATTLELNL